MNQKVSVIVPMWNREKLIERCLNSILNQTEKPGELIVVDNNSTDDSYGVVENWINRHKDRDITFKLLKEEMPGAYAARQKGFENANGEWVIFFDSDDEMLPQLLERAQSVIKNNQETDLVCWKCRIFQLDGSTKIPPFSTENPIENHLIHTLLRPQGYIIRKKFLEKVEGWKKSIPVWDDYELGLRILLENPKVIGINEVLALIYSQTESITGEDFSSKEGMWEATLDEMELMTRKSSHPEKRRILKILNYRRVILAAHYYKENNKSVAKKLLQKAFLNSSLWGKIILSFSYLYTGQGFRGVWRIVGKIY